ncbi:hypothetical protein I5L01_00045 [Erythrobacter sp. YJ-T3-07]|uniref:hypothetical protein n=1 Tax=Erythrobacter sp. YJ-T3-07 TaxID=2793063 RepID=UPI0018D2A46D|nr:hypothetical protein [Erythrobacter sp. YJ-T3-07]MBH1942608.1 hypothetical protein [Erythrobacter sp. YJ-T3-07]
MTLVITTCTNRKLKPVSEALRACTLPQASLADLASIWGARIRAAVPRYPASDIYAGRGFQEARLAASTLEAPMFIVSAGLGLVEASANIPSYACTVVAGVDDSIVARANDPFELPAWWKLLSQFSPFSTRLSAALARTPGLVLAALSESYVAMVSADLAELAPQQRARLRIFTRAPSSRIPPELADAVMPYDDRLEGDDSPLQGTRGDFAARAMRHFAQHIILPDDDRSPVAHADAVTVALDGWRFPERVARVRHDDATMRRLIAEHWHGSDPRGPTLRFFRDDLLIACEQRRFKDLKHEVRRAES